jgi:hypothetical protein
MPDKDSAPTRDSKEKKLPPPLTEAEVDALFDDVEDEAPILASLAPLPRWVPWREETRTGKDGEPVSTKPPYSARGRGMAKVDNPATWGTRAQAETRARTLRNGSRKGGIGLMLGELGDTSA